MIKIQRQDKEEVIFYNNSEYEISVDEGTTFSSKDTLEDEVF